jgi:Holliday junction resolvase
MPRRPASRYRRRYRLRIGYEGEYYLMRRFVDLGVPGYYAVRTPGSGTGKVYKPDLLVVDGGELYALEVKSTNRERIYVRPEQLERLLKFTELFRVMCPHCGESFTPRPVLAVRFLTRGWVFREVDGKGVVYVSSPVSGKASPGKDKRRLMEGHGHDALGEEVPDSGGHQRDRPGDGEALRAAWGEARPSSEAAINPEKAGRRDSSSGGKAADGGGGLGETGRCGAGDPRDPKKTGRTRRPNQLRGREAGP